MTLYGNNEGLTRILFEAVAELDHIYELLPLVAPNEQFTGNSNILYLFLIIILEVTRFGLRVKLAIMVLHRNSLRGLS